ncbi:ATP-binding response regulator [Blautia sp. MSJ-9]|uniref:ATP-binding response regulator n=1 Tax=Blautia sp. MSJ-9 TaxID=2841511 RepID=UPI001C0FA302|nr:transporter substrate-binding domain-containing protein [Blautia sp. MSJ-9]
MKKKITALLCGMLLLVLCCCPVYADYVPQVDTPDYKVAFYAYDCYHMQDSNGKKYGYGYDMMQDLSEYLQCTFSYVGYEKSAKECEEMLQNGEVDIYTAAKITPEREEEFAFSKHPAITSTTCMNVKRGNQIVIAGDYSTYNGLKIGLLKRHTYNDRFIQFTKEKGFDCSIVYYDTPTDLSNALINGEVDALVNSYIRTPEDETTIEDFGETPYYFMARKEDQKLLDRLDKAIDEMNIESPNWRVNLYNEYYGSQDSNTELTDDEKALLKKMQAEHTTIRAVMNPDNNPYSWYEDDHGYGITADLFAETVKALGLDYEIIPVSSRQEYKELLETGNVDVCIDMDSYYSDEGDYKYKLTDSYLTTTASVLKRRGSSGKMRRIGVTEENLAMKEIIDSSWPNAELILLENTGQCVQKIISGEIDGALMMSYTAQKVARDDVQNRLSVEIVPGMTLEVKMGINHKADHNFVSLWKKTLKQVSVNKSDELVQEYLDKTDIPNLGAYLFDHPMYLVVLAGLLFFVLMIVGLYIESTKAKNKQLRISEQLSEALMDAKRANDAKINFFSKMSHDIRTPLNVVLGMTQIAKKYQNEPEKLDNALENITSEGNYLLTMINSILDVNQLSHGHVELVYKPFNPDECMRDSMKILLPLAERKKQNLTFSSNFREHVVVGDSSRFSQIMVNIVSNAIKYTESGGRIKVTLEEVLGNRYRFTCEDNGIGMSQDYLKHICEEYSRADDKQISATEGTGLGMSVVKGFTELMHGTLQVESQLGKGSTFIVEIPFGEPSIKERELVINANEEQNFLPSEFKGKKVLLAEDNALNAEIAVELLQSIGLTAELAEDGEQAVQKYENSAQNEYFAIFMDMQMPVMDGVEATKQIRASKRHDHDICIIAMTANTLARDRNICEEAGMDGYLSKPIHLKDIGRALKEYVNE